MFFKRIHFFQREIVIGDLVDTQQHIKQPAAPPYVFHVQFVRSFRPLHHLINAIYIPVFDDGNYALLRNPRKKDVAADSICPARGRRQRFPLFYDIRNKKVLRDTIYVMHGFVI